MPNRVNPRSGKALAICAALVVWFLATGDTQAQPAGISPADPTGEWLVAKKLARIKIADCDGRLWGIVAWEAQPGIDNKNPDPNLRSRPTLGMPILLGMTPSKPNQWDGQIYNSQDGRIYAASISLVDPNTLQVKGCFLGFLCGGENWTRVETASVPGSGQDTPPKTPQPPKNRKAAGGQSEPADSVCSRIPGVTGISHERGLK